MKNKIALNELALVQQELTLQKDLNKQLSAALNLAKQQLNQQAKEKGNRIVEIGIANMELAFQGKEIQKQKEELKIADLELDFKNAENDRYESVNKKLETLSYSEKLTAQYSRSLIEASLDPLVTINAWGKITDVNQASIHVTGVPRAKLISTDFSNYFTDPEKAQAGYLKAFEKGFVSDYPLTIKHKNGKLTDVLYNASVYKDVNGKVLGVFAAARDVTLQNEIEANLKKSLEEISGYKKALDKSSIVAITDNNGVINHVNNNFCKISKYKRKELVGQDHKVISSGFHSIDFYDRMWKTIEKGKTWREEIQDKAKDGSIYWVDTTIVPFLNEAGEIYQYVSIGTDITAKKLHSQYTLSLIEASRDPLITISPEGKITDMNEATVSITGVARKKLIGTNFKDYFTDPKKACEVYQEVFKKGFVADYPLTITDGKLTDVLFNGSVYKDDRENVIGAVIVARDLTEQKRIEKELIEAKELADAAKYKAENAMRIAENAVKSKQLFLSNMSHEIRTPMNAIIGFTKVVLKTDLSAKQKEYLSAIKISGDALIVLINDILDLAKVDAGKMTFEQTPFKMAVSIATMLHLFETKIQEKNLKLVKAYDLNIPEVLVGDPVRLHQIILNLVSNAVKFTNKGEIKVSIQLIKEDSENVSINFSVSDTGIGIASDKLTTVFESFQQATSGTARIYGGTGLGLAIAKQLIETQGGDLQVESELEKGTTFSFVLNFKKTKEVLEEETEGIELDTQIKNIKVLVAEDMELNQLLMKTLLDDFGFERDIAANGKIAIEKLQQKTYDIVLMDLQMPEMNGFETTEYIRKKLNSKIPIIALTADVTTVDLAKCKAVGMNDYIAKPVDEKLLYNKIIGLVKKRNLIKRSVIKMDELKRCTNLKYLNRRTKSNPKLMMEMIAIYLEQTPVLIESMKKSLEHKDWSTLVSAAHKMIPSFSIMGMSSDYEIMAKTVQEIAHAQLHNDELFGLLTELESISLQACQELEEEFHNLKSN